MVEAIIIEVPGDEKTKIYLSMEAAKKLYEDLDKLFRKEKEYVPYPVEVPRYYPPYIPVQPYIWIKSTSDTPTWKVTSTSGDLTEYHVNDRAFSVTLASVQT